MCLEDDQVELLWNRVICAYVLDIERGTVTFTTDWRSAKQFERGASPLRYTRSPQSSTRQYVAADTEGWVTAWGVQPISGHVVLEAICQYIDGQVGNDLITRVDLARRLPWGGVREIVTAFRLPASHLTGYPYPPDMIRQLDQAIQTSIADLADEDKHIPINEEYLEYDERFPGAVFLNAKVFAELIAGDQQLQGMIKQQLKELGDDINDGQ